ncbi:uncharacterized protein LOC34618378 [Cyclospora cayetanensis]|uniref:Uncharacterized protein LOC34618378 n=1 Tax=Cyclospora cayetanensis TaxID=88456 RepID=A0A6P6RQG6_9EIME|nr:uncharacterized protein LOC34618378 [Cyclospora cayetanensis]
MKLVKSLAGALLVSMWLIVHATFMVHTNPLSQHDKYGTKGIHPSIPIRLPSVFQLSWFHKLVKQIFTVDQLAMPREVCGDSCVAYLAWIVSVLTLAEWLAFTVLLLKAVWNKLIRPIFSIIGLVLLTTTLYGCLRCSAFMLVPHLPEDSAEGVLRMLVAVDGAFLHVWNSVVNATSWALWLVDGLLSSLTWPSLEAMRDDTAHASHWSLLNNLIIKVKEVTSHLPDAVHPEL